MTFKPGLFFLRVAVFFIITVGFFIIVFLSFMTNFLLGVIVFLLLLIPYLLIYQLYPESVTIAKNSLIIYKSPLIKKTFDLENAVTLDAYTSTSYANYPYQMSVLYYHTSSDLTKDKGRKSNLQGWQTADVEKLLTEVKKRFPHIKEIYLDKKKY